METTAILTHKFEVRGLGKGPFRCVGLTEKYINHGEETQPAGTCDYCSTGIRYCYHIRSADGREFIVGSECVKKTGDAGLVKGMKAAKKAAERARIAEEYMSASKELRALIEAHKPRLESLPHPRQEAFLRPVNFYQYCDWFCGHGLLVAKKFLIEQVKEIASA